MRAARVTEEGGLVISEIPTPRAGPGEVVIRVAYCGICGSDVHLLHAGLLPPGCVIGHELSGTVAEVGRGVQGWVAGDRVVVLPMDPCFSCEPCKRGDIQICKEGLSRSYGLGLNPGGFSQFMLVKPSMLVRIPEGLDMRTAALNEPWSVAVHGVNLAGFPMGGRAAVMGAGPIGLLCVAALRAAGAAEVYVSEPDPFRADRARAAAVDLVIDPSKEPPGDAIRARVGEGPNFVFDCAGTRNSLEEAAAIVAHHGRVVVLGVQMGNASIFPLNWFAKETRLSFSFAYTHAEFGTGVRLLARGAVDTGKIVTDVVPLADIQKAIEWLHGSGHGKVLVDCQAA